MNSSPTIILHQVQVLQAGKEQTTYWGTSPIGPAHFMDIVSTSGPARIKGGELSTVADESCAKVRKPYTITKQRERWTEDEHQKFLEALKLYGRAWRRIEEHIGTKTAVQIRSHAQKFFSKVERDVSIGLPAGIVQDIAIPPPRPKRKPNHPYPRKAGIAISGRILAVEEEIISPPRVPSTFTLLGRHLESSLQVVPFKNGISNSYSNQSTSSMLDRAEDQKMLSESPQTSVSSTRLKLFGQTLVVPVVERFDTSMADTLQPNSVNRLNEPTAVSTSEDSQRKVYGNPQISSQVKLKSSNLTLCDNNNTQAEAWERLAIMVPSHGKLDIFTSSYDSYKVEPLKKCLGVPGIGILNQQNIASHSECDQAWTHGSNDCKEHHKGMHKEGHQWGSALTESKSTHEVVNNSMLVSNRMPSCLCDGVASIQHMRCPQGMNSNVPSQNKTCGNYDISSQNYSPNSTGSSFPSWHLGQDAIRQDPETSAVATVCPVSVLTNYVHNVPKDGTCGASLQGVVPPASDPPKVYNPVAIIAGATGPSFLSSVIGLDTEMKHNASDIYEDKEQTARNMKISNTLKHHACTDNSQQSSQECYSSAESAFDAWHGESSNCHVEAKPLKKRFRSSDNAEEVESRKGRSGGSSIGSNEMVENNDCERMEDNHIHFPLRANNEVNVSNVVGEPRRTSGICGYEIANGNADQVCSCDNIPHCTEDIGICPSADIEDKHGDLEIEKVDHNDEIGIHSLVSQKSCYTTDIKQKGKIQGHLECVLSQGPFTEEMDSMGSANKSQTTLHNSIDEQYCTKTIEHESSRETFKMPIKLSKALSCMEPSSVSQGKGDKGSGMYSKDIAKSSETEENNMVEDYFQVQSTVKCQHVGERKSLSIAKIGCLIRSPRHDGVGFVPYQKSLEDGQTSCCR